MLIVCVEAQAGLLTQVNVLGPLSNMCRTSDFIGCSMSISQLANAGLHSPDTVHPYARGNVAPRYPHKVFVRCKTDLGGEHDDD